MKLFFNIVCAVCFVTLASAQYKSNTAEDSIVSLFHKTQINVDTWQTSRLNLGIIDNALKIAKNLKNDTLIAKCYLRKGVLFMIEKDFENAHVYTNKALSIYKKQNNSDRMAWLHYRVGKGYFLNKKTNQALDQYFLSLDQVEQLNKHLDFSAYLGVAEVYFYLKNDLKTTQNYLLKAKDYSSKYDTTAVNMVGVLSLLGKVALKNGEEARALNYYKKADVYGNKEKNFKQLAENEQELCKHFEASDITIAYKHLKRELDYRSQFNKSYDDIIADIDYSIGDKLDEVLVINKASKKHLKKLRFIAMISLYAIILIGGILFVLKLKNKKLKKLKKLAIQGSEEKSKFINKMSFELRTPLNAVIGFSNVLIEEKHREEQKQYLLPLISSADYLLNLVNNVLNLNPENKIKDSITFSIFNIEEFLNKLVASFSLQLQINNNKMKLYIDPRISQYVNADYVKINQVLVNLINNANKFSHNSTIELSLNLIKNFDDNCDIIFSVKDYGVGIADDKKEQIFNQFSHKTFENSRTHDGAGLGLFIVRKLLGVMQSDLEIVSAVNEGSTFSFKLNLLIASKYVSANKKSINLEMLKDMNVLVIEDNVTNQLLVSKELNKINARYDICNNGKEGLDRFNEMGMSYYKAILMDLHMPIMDGYDATLAIRKLNSEIPIIVLTATSIENTEENLNKHKFSAIMHKPYKTDMLYKEFNNLLKGQNPMLN